MRVSYFLVIVICSAFFFTGCKSEKKISDLSPSEKAHLEIKGDSELSPEEYDLQIKARMAILDRVGQTNQSELALKEAMENAKTVLTISQYQELELSQKQWTHQGRGRDINLLITQGVSAGDAYAKAGFARADFIQQQTSRIMLISNPGLFNGFYISSDGREMELYEIPNSKLNLVLRSRDKSFVYTAQGSYTDKNARLCSVNAELMCVIMTRNTENTVSIEPDTSLVGDKTNAIRPMLEGSFLRITSIENVHVFTP